MLVFLLLPFHFTSLSLSPSPIFIYLLHNKYCGLVNHKILITLIIIIIITYGTLRYGAGTHGLNRQLNRTSCFWVYEEEKFTRIAGCQLLVSSCGSSLCSILYAHQRLISHPVPTSIVVVIIKKKQSLVQAAKSM